MDDWLVIVLLLFVIIAGGIAVYYLIRYLRNSSDGPGSQDREKAPITGGHMDSYSQKPCGPGSCSGVRRSLAHDPFKFGSRPCKNCLAILSKAQLTRPPVAEPHTQNPDALAPLDDTLDDLQSLILKAQSEQPKTST